jgi:hypothetical protein
MCSCEIMLQASLPCNQQMEKDPSLISALREYAISILVFYDSIAVEQNSSFDILLFLISILPLHGSLLVLCITSNSYVSNTQSLMHRDLHTSKQKRSKDGSTSSFQGFPVDSILSRDLPHSLSLNIHSSISLPYPLLLVKEVSLNTFLFFLSYCFQTRTGRDTGHSLLVQRSRMSSSCIFSLLVACMAVEKQLYLTASRPGLGPTQSLVRCVTPALFSEKCRRESEANY